MTAHRINPPIIMRQGNQEAVGDPKFTKVSSEKQTTPSFMKALATSVALVFAAIIVCITSPILKLTGLSITDVLKNIYGEIHWVWFQRQIIASHSTPSDTRTPLETAILDVLRAQDKSPELQILNQLFLKQYSPGEVISDLEKFGSQDLKTWDLTIGDSTKTYEIPELLAKDSDRHPMVVTIHTSDFKPNTVMSLETTKEIGSQISYEIPDREKIIQRKSLELILGGLFACSSIDIDSQIDPNLLCLFSQSSPGNNLTAFSKFISGQSNNPLIKKLNFIANNLQADVYDVNQKTLKIVYTGSITIQENGVEIGSISYYKTLEMEKKEGNKWVDLSFGNAAPDGITLQMNGRQAIPV